jgi:hypothetical protein
MSNIPPKGQADSVIDDKCQELDPIDDPRWAEFVRTHPSSSVFHSVGWLEALRRTYAYKTAFLTTSTTNEPLKNGIVFCQIKSWLTGHRLVALPFSDHCQPLCDSAEEFTRIIRALQHSLHRGHWKYLEIRPVDQRIGRLSEQTGFSPSARYFLHILDLQPELNEIFLGLDKDSVQRRVRRAERSGLAEVCGQSSQLLKHFYELFVLTRRRHSLPPSPYSWFQNLVECLGAAVEIRVAYLKKIPVSAILTVRFKNVVYYKYGGSSAKFNNLGATPWLLWNAVVDAKSRGALSFDLGRTETDNPGLLAFKNHWVSNPLPMDYWRYPGGVSRLAPDSFPSRLAKTVFSLTPSGLLRITGRMLYRHIG